jgi:hypothetical protein
MVLCDLASNPLMDQPCHTRGMVDLPPELIVTIFENLPDFQSLASTRQTCHYLYQCFGVRDKSITYAIFSNVCHSFKGHDRNVLRLRVRRKLLSRIIWQVIFTIHQRWIPRDSALKIFRHGWDLIANEGLEELLVPIGMELALSLKCQGRQEDAIALLKDIEHGMPAFRSSRKYYCFLPGTLLPLRVLLSQLKGESFVNMIDLPIDIQLALQQIPIALLTSKGTLFFDAKIHLPQGMHLGKEFALIRIRKIPRPRRIYSLSELEHILSEQPGPLPQAVLRTIKRLHV